MMHDRTAQSGQGQSDVQRMLRGARPDQIMRLLNDIQKTAPSDTQTQNGQA